MWGLTWTTTGERYLEAPEDSVNDPVFDHYQVHRAYEFKVPNVFRELACPVCCGLPPWEWGSSDAHALRVVPISAFNSSDRVGKMGKDAAEEAFRRSHLLELPYVGAPSKGARYAVIVRCEFGWKNFRVFGFLRRPYGTCRVCRKFKAIAEHKLNCNYRDYDALSICLGCARKETRRLRSLPLADLTASVLNELKREKRNEARSRKY